MRTHLWNLFPIITKEPITVYKVLRGGNAKSTAKSPYQGHIYALGVQEEAYIEKRLGFWPPRIKIHEGLHAFVDLKNAKNEIWAHARGHHVYECVIPAGSKIYRGFWDEGGKIPNIVSNKLTVVKIYEEE